MALRELLERIMQRSEPASLPHVAMDVPMRGSSGRFSASPKTLEECRRRGSVNAQLGVYVALTTPEQRRAETEARITELRAIARSVGQGRTGA